MKKHTVLLYLIIVLLVVIVCIFVNTNMSDTDSFTIIQDLRAYPSPDGTYEVIMQRCLSDVGESAGTHFIRGIYEKPANVIMIGF